MRRLALVLVLALAVTACGDDGGDSPGGDIPPLSGVDMAAVTIGGQTWEFDLERCITVPGGIGFQGVAGDGTRVGGWLIVDEARTEDATPNNVAVSGPDGSWIAGGERAFGERKEPAQITDFEVDGSTAYGSALFQSPDGSTTEGAFHAACA